MGGPFGAVWWVVGRSGPWTLVEDSPVSAPKRSIHGRRRRHLEARAIYRHLVASFSCLRTVHRQPPFHLQLTAPLFVRFVWFSCCVVAAGLFHLNSFRPILGFTMILLWISLLSEVTLDPTVSIEALLASKVEGDLKGLATLLLFLVVNLCVALLRIARVVCLPLFAQPPSRVLYCFFVLCCMCPHPVTPCSQCVDSVRLE